MANETAPDGQLFVCGACGKRSRDRYGLDKIDNGYDESCMLNSVLCHAEKRLVTMANGEMQWLYVAVQS